MRLGLSCLAVSALAIVAVWAWLGAPVPMPQAPLHPGEKLYCLSYAPFHGRQTPLDPTTHVSAAEIDKDLTQLARLTDCVRTYSTDYGLDQIAGIAAKHGLKVIQGLWLSRNPATNAVEIDRAVALAKRYPGTIRAVVVGNEVLLRGEMAAGDLANTIRAVKARVPVPVTYADVWEFWLRNPVLATAADFVTIHILPYWEDFPIAADQAAAHVAAIRRRVVNAFPGKDVLIGEVGWPSAGRMREGALPSPANQARVIQDVLALAAREKFHVNVIEAYDQPWKRAFEGTVGGHWGIINDGARQLKFSWGEAVSNHPWWRWQAAGGVAFAVLVFGVSFAVARGHAPTPARWLAVTGNALAGGVLIGWTIANVPLESLGLGGWTALAGAHRRGDLERAAGERRDHGRCGDPALLTPTRASRAAHPRSAGDCRGRGADRDDAAGCADRARAGVRSALQGFSVRTADGGCGAVPAAHAGDAAPARAPRRCGNTGRRAAGAVGAVYPAQRKLRQLAVALALRGIARARRQSGAGARRAKLSSSSPTATDESAVL